MSVRLQGLTSHDMGCRILDLMLCVMGVFAVIAVLAICLTGCAGTVKPQAPVIPKIISVPVDRYVPIPPELTAPCHRTERASNQVVDVVDAYNKRGDDIDECNKRMTKIRDLGTQP